MSGEETELQKTKKKKMAKKGSSHCFRYKLRNVKQLIKLSTVFSTPSEYTSCALSLGARALDLWAADTRNLYTHR